MRSRVTFTVLMAIAVSGSAMSTGSAMSAGFDYADARARAVKVCEAIDASQFQSGLFFNPDGYRSYYVRSKCFQEAAIQFRDSALCEQVRQRRSLFASSWGYSSARCRELVAQGQKADRAELNAIKGAHAAGAVRLREFRLQRNGNGRDIDIIPAFTGSYAHTYTLTFEILNEADGAPVLLHSSGYHIDGSSNLSVYVPQADIRRRFPGFSLNRVYTVRATMALDVGFGGQSGYWSPAFIESVFPTRERSQSMTIRAAF